MGWVTSRTRCGVATSGPESKPPLSSWISALDKDRPLGPLDHLVTVVMRKAPRGRYIGSRDIFIHNRATIQVYKNRAMSDKIVLAQNQNPRTPPPLHFHAFTLKCHVNLLMPGLH
jgi:hypothetical protein